MQNPYQRVLAARATSGGSAGQAYDSFIDFEGFPTAAAGGSASYTSSPMSHQSQHSTAFMNDNLVAKKALAAYLMVSADAGSVMMILVERPSYNDATFIAAA